MNNTILINNKYILLFGFIGTLFFFTSMFATAMMVENYSHLQQHVSEIGEVGSPAEIPHQIVSLIFPVFILFFALGIFRFAKSNSLLTLPTYFLGLHGLAQFASALFPLPHPLHDAFSIPTVISLMSPLVLAISWRRLGKSDPLIKSSWIGFGFVILAIIANLNRNLFPSGYDGLVQRSFFVSFYGWCTYISLTLYQRTNKF